MQGFGKMRLLTFKIWRYILNRISMQTLGVPF